MGELFLKHNVHQTNRSTNLSIKENDYEQEAQPLLW